MALLIMEWHDRMRRDDQMQDGGRMAGIISIAAA